MKMTLFRQHWRALAGITGICGTLALGFVWLPGRAGSARLTSFKVIDAMEAGNAAPFYGFRCGHPKGVCVVGRFSDNGAASARMFSQTGLVIATFVAGLPLMIKPA